MTTACRTGDRTFQQVAALENQLGQWRAFTPPLWATHAIDGSTDRDQWTEVNLGAGGARNGWFMRIGDRLVIRYAFSWGQAPWYAAPGRIVTDLPSGLLGERTAAQYLHCHLWTTSGTEGRMNFVGSGLVSPGSEIVQPMFPNHAQDCRLDFYAIAGPADGQRDWSVPYIVTGFPEGGLLAIQGTLQLA